MSQAQSDYQRAAGAAAESPEPVQPLEPTSPGQTIAAAGLILAGMAVIATIIFLFL